MAYYTPKSDRQRKRYKSDTKMCGENGICPPFCLSALPHLAKNYENHVIRT